MVSRTVHAMGTTFTFIVDAEPGNELTAAIDAAIADVAELEARLSRFRPDSELCELNRTGHIDASDDLLVLAKLAVEARDETEGRFDPTVHAAMMVAGYDRPFDELPVDAPGDAGAGASCGGRVDVDLDLGTVRLGPGVAIDLGGIAKGYAAEVACDRLAPAGPCLVNAGGDIATRGTPAATGHWAIAVPTTGATLVVGIGAGGLATSGRDRRTWRRGGAPAHHIIEPATGRPADGDILRVTAVAGSAVQAEVLATALFLAGGADRAIIEAETKDIPAVVVCDDGRTLTTRGLA